MILTYTSFLESRNIISWLFYTTKYNCIFIVSVYKFITSYTGTLVLHGHWARSHSNFRIIVVDSVLFCFKDVIINIVGLGVNIYGKFNYCFRTSSSRKNDRCRKLRDKIGYRIEENISYKNIKLTISIKKSITIKKEYDDICSVINGKGYIKKYEPIFYTNKPHINGNIVYEGQVEKNIPSGDGTYYYHTSKTQNNELNSNDLIDSNAQKITKILINNGKSTNIEAKAIGKFVEGKKVNGFIESKEFNEKISINEGSDSNE